jgi:hypothetical protein
MKMAFSGMDALFAAAAEAKAAKASSSGAWRYFQLKEDDKVMVRFISNNIVPTNLYKIKTADGKYAEVVDSDDCPVKDYPDIFFSTSQKGDIYPQKSILTGLGILVKREEVIETVDGRRVRRVRDMEEEVKDAQGNVTKRVVPYLVKANFSNFWSNLEEIYLRNDNDITTLDISVKRKGNSFQTTYDFFPVPSPEFNQPGEAEEHYTELLGKENLPDVDKWIESKSSQEWYKKILYPLIPELAEATPEKESSVDTSEKSVDGEASDDVKLASLTDKIRREREARASK